MTKPHAASFHKVVNQVIAEQTKTTHCSCKQLAGDLHVNYRSFQHWQQPGPRRIPAEVLPELCKLLNDYKLLDSLEERAGRIGFVVPSVTDLTSLEDVMAIQHLVREVGEALQELAQTLKDHRVEDDELARTIPELDDVIRECARLKHWLTERNRIDRQHSRKVSRDQRCVQPRSRSQATA